MTMQTRFVSGGRRGRLNNLDPTIPPRIYLEPGAPYSLIATQIASDTGMHMTSDRTDAGLVLLEEETAQRTIRAHGWAFHPRARVIYIPGMLFIEDKCKLAHLLATAPYHPQTAVESASPAVIAQSHRWIEKRGLGANGQDVRIVTAAEILDAHGSGSSSSSSSSSGPAILAAGWAKEGHVLQRYEEDVMLFEGRKFDMRVHAIMLADGRFAIHRDALVRRCARPYSISESDPASQITNMSVQKRFDPSLRSVTTTLSELPYSLRTRIAPKVLACISDLLGRFHKQTARAAEESLGGKILRERFAFRMFGIDILPLRNGDVKVLEVNYRPAINLSGAVAPFYKRLIRWMGDVLLTSESPELTLPESLCEPLALARIHPLAFHLMMEMGMGTRTEKKGGGGGEIVLPSPPPPASLSLLSHGHGGGVELRLISSPRLEIELEVRRQQQHAMAMKKIIYVNRDWALSRGKTVNKLHVIKATASATGKDLSLSEPQLGWIAVDPFFVVDDGDESKQAVVAIINHHQLPPELPKTLVAWFGVWRPCKKPNGHIQFSDSRTSSIRTSMSVSAISSALKIGP